MAAKKRTGLGRGIGALIPPSSSAERPVDVFFSAGTSAKRSEDRDAATNQTESETSKAAGRGKGAAKTRSTATRSTAQASDGVGADAAATSSTETDTTDAATADTASIKSSATDAVARDSELQEVPGAQLTQLEVSEIVPNRVQPRREFDEEALEELTHSIREFGVFQPIVVRPIEDAEVEGARYELIMGERRLRATKRAGLTEIPAIVRSTEDENMLRDALLENLHRAELNPLEEASAYQQLMSDFGITQEQLASRIGRSRPQISNTIRLLRLPETVQSRVAAGVLSAGHARAILSLDGDADAMQKLADKIINEGLSVRGAEAAANSTPKRKLPKPRAGARRDNLSEISERLGDRLDTKVAIKLGAKKGQITIDFATIGDLGRILKELGDPGFQ